MAEQEKKGMDGNSLLAAGAGVGAVGALGALVVGAVCPLCIVATPALVGAGLVQKWRESRRTAACPEGPAPAAAEEATPSGG